MYFPLIERRFYTGDRRAGKLDRRQQQRSVAEQTEKRSNAVRREGKDRRVLKLERETLLCAALLAKDKAAEPEKSKILSICSLIVIPFTIGVTSLAATYLINQKQMESAQLIADQQKESAELIAQGQRENASQIANAEMETQHLVHMVEILTNIISPKKETTQNDKSLIQLVRSLTVYGNEALPFLIQIREHEKKQVSNEVDSAIRSIVENSQLDLNRSEIIGTEASPVNLRKKDYVNYNLNDSVFKFVNLYKADLSDASLQRAKFHDVDLQETTFHNANLRKANFKRSKLRKADFTNAFIEGVTFEDCVHIEDAIFSLHTLLNPDKEPINTISKNRETYMILLAHYEQEISEKDNKEEQKLKPVLVKLGITNLDELKDMLKAIKEKGLAGRDDNKAIKQASIMEFFWQ